MERAFFSASADVLQRGILLPSFELPGYSSNQIFLSPSCYRPLTPAIMCPLCFDSQVHNSSFIFFKLKCWNIGISRTGTWLWQRWGIKWNQDCLTKSRARSPANISTPVLWQLPTTARIGVRNSTHHGFCHNSAVNLGQITASISALCQFLVLFYLKPLEQ